MLRQRLFVSLSACNRSLSLSSTSYCEPPQRFTIDAPAFKPLSESKQRKIDDDKRKLEWRVRPMKQPYAFKSNLSTFDRDPAADDEERVPNTLAYMTKPIDWRFSAFKEWLKKHQTQKEIFLQQFIPERHAILGNDLAAAHFLLFRAGKVRFVGQKEWMTMDPNEDYRVPLPEKYDPNFQLEAISCEGMTLYYEGLENIRRLKRLRHISFKGVSQFDDWCMDRVSGSEFPALETLDISQTQVTSNGLQALYRLSTLKKLIVTAPSEKEEENIAWDLTLAMLQDIMPHLEIVSSKNITA